MVADEKRRRDVWERGGEMKEMEEEQRDREKGKIEIRKRGPSTEGVSECRGGGSGS